MLNIYVEAEKVNETECHPGSIMCGIPVTKSNLSCL